MLLQLFVTKKGFPMLRLLSVAVLGFASACTVPDFRAPLTAPQQVPVLVSPTPTPTPLPTPVNPASAKERFVQAVEANGCTFSSANSGTILADATLSQGDLGGIITELRTEGRGSIAPDGQGFRLNTGLCA